MQVRSTDGTSIAVHSTGHGPPILFVHGTATDHRDWDAVVHALPEFACHVMDRRGRGGSGDNKQHSLKQEADDIRIAAAAVGAKVVVAHSFGALACIEAATGDLPPCLLYEPPFVEHGDPAAAKPLEALLARRDLGGVVSAFLTDIAGAHPADVAEFKRSPGWSIALSAAPTVPREVRAFLSYRFDGAKFRSRKPMAALLRGSDSPDFFTRAASRVADAWGAPVHVLSHQGHEALTTAPDEVARQVRAFVSYVARKSGARPVPRYVPL